MFFIKTSTLTQLAVKVFRTVFKLQHFSTFMLITLVAHNLSFKINLVTESAIRTNDILK